MGRYDQILGWVGVKPSRFKEAEGVIQAVEKRIGRKLPGAVAEWLAIEGIEEISNRYSNSDPVVAAGDLGKRDMGEYLHIRSENQGVCYWGVLMNGEEDPPVFVANEMDFKNPVMYARLFSEYARAFMWDWRRVLQDNAGIQAQNRPVSKEALEFMKGRFSSEVETWGWLGETQHRFYTPTQRVLIWAGEQQADWNLAGDSEDDLQLLVKMLWEVDDLGKSLWSNDGVGERILKRVRDDMAC